MGGIYRRGGYHDWKGSGANSRGFEGARPRVSCQLRLRIGPRCEESRGRGPRTERRESEALAPHRGPGARPAKNGRRGPARRGPQPDEEPLASLRGQSAEQREESRNRSDVRRTARTDLRTSALAPPRQEEITQ